MYAVIATGGKQYKVEPGDTIKVEKLAAEDGATITFDQVLLVAQGDDLKVGAPTLATAKVTAQVLGTARDKKLLVYKYARRKGYRRKNGHRQSLTSVKITDIKA